MAATRTGTLADIAAATTPGHPSLPLVTSTSNPAGNTSPWAATGAVVDGGRQASVKPVQRTLPYDGRADSDAYCTQFEMLNCWTNVEKAMYLAISLKDQP